MAMSHDRSNYLPPSFCSERMEKLRANLDIMGVAIKHSRTCSGVPATRALSLAAFVLSKAVVILAQQLWICSDGFKVDFFLLQVARCSLSSCLQIFNTQSYDFREAIDP
mmetsp:Transcript_96286/g.171037  ORF Transcript_96286/g.171037 Transcript_96286/m.171037 type:complete len:109 (-) Transcript_96286:395-721(-)